LFDLVAFGADCRHNSVPIRRSPCAELACHSPEAQTSLTSQICEGSGVARCPSSHPRRGTRREVFESLVIGFLAHFLIVLAA
jgi:hypothetical protein